MTWQEVEALARTQLRGQGNLSVDHFSKDGMTEYFHPKEFTVLGERFWWSIHRGPKGGIQIWLRSNDYPSEMVGRGEVCLWKIRKGYRIISQRFNNLGMTQAAAS